MAPPRTLMEYIQLASGHLKACGIPTHRLDAEVLLAHILNLERIQLYIQHDRPLTTAEVDAYRRAVAATGPQGTCRLHHGEAGIFLDRALGRPALPHPPSGD